MNEQLQKTLKKEIQEIEEIAYFYEKKYGKENALLEFLKDERSRPGRYFGMTDYIEITWKENEETKRLKFRGNIVPYAEDLIFKINEKHDICLVYRLNDIYKSFYEIKKGDFLCL